jgi:hypothetical protein
VRAGSAQEKFFEKATDEAPMEHGRWTTTNNPCLFHVSSVATESANWLLGGWRAKAART